MKERSQKLSLPRWFDKLVSIFLPISFVGMVFLNVLAFALDGHKHEWFRQLFVIGIQGIAVLVLFVKCLDLLRKKAVPRQLLVGTVCIVALFFLLHIWGVTAQTNKVAIIKDMIIIL